MARPPAPGIAIGPVPVETAEDFQRATGVSRETLARLEHYAALLRRWQGRHNLVGPRTLDRLWQRHMLDSAQVMALLPEPPPGRARRLVDLGSGAGFPGLVLALLGAGEVHLVETKAAKAAFLRHVAAETGASATVHHGRVEALPALGADVVTARALAPLETLLALAVRHLAPGGCAILHKGAHAEEELTAAGKTWMMAVERFPSVTDPAARLLRVSAIARRGAPTPRREAGLPSERDEADG
jgi:16S rRNA (guanine527-N7)-methyltransferase